MTEMKFYYKNNQRETKNTYGAYFEILHTD